MFVRPGSPRGPASGTAPTELAEEVRERVPDRKSYLGVIDRLNKASVDKHWEAYADIPWDDPEFQVDESQPPSVQLVESQPPSVQVAPVGPIGE